VSPIGAALMQMKDQMKNLTSKNNDGKWPERPNIFPELMTPVEAAMFLRLDEIGHSPKSARRTLNYWRDCGDLRATKYSRHVWYLKNELQKFLGNKTEEGM
jgi:hypothetical protein